MLAGQTDPRAAAGGSDRAARHRLARSILTGAGFGYVPVFSVNGKVVPWPDAEAAVEEAVRELAGRTGR